MTDDIILRRGMPADHEALGEVMYAAVRNGPSRYTPAQQVAWVPEPRRGTAWPAYVLVRADRGPLVARPGDVQRARRRRNTVRKFDV